MESKNTYITYWQLLSLIHPYFMANWWEDFMSPNELSSMINMAIQDLFNTATYSFNSEFESVTADNTLHWWVYKVFKTQYPIEEIHQLLLNWEWDDLTKYIVNRMPYTNITEFHFRKWTNTIYASTSENMITINYTKSYDINMMVTNEDLAKPLPIPFSYIPALVKMIYDTSAPFTFFQWEWNTTDFYSHWKSRINELIQRDRLSSNESIQLWER